MEQNEVLTVTGKSPDRHWKTTDYKMSGQLKRLQNEKAELLKILDGHLADVKSHLAQNKTVTAETACQCFFENCKELQEKKTATEATLEAKVLGEFCCQHQTKIGQKKKRLNWLVEQIPKLREIAEYSSCVLNQRKGTMRLYTMSKKSKLFYREAVKLGEQLGSENLDDTRKQALSSKLEELITKLGSTHAALIQIVKSDITKDWLTT